MGNFSPDFCETRINRINYFSFLLPATALGIDSDLIIEISVDYGDSQDKTKVTANSWAREKSSLIKGFITTVHVSPGDNEDERIFNKLNASQEFKATLVDFIQMLLSQ